MRCVRSCLSFFLSRASVLRTSCAIWMLDLAALKLTVSNLAARLLIAQRPVPRTADARSMRMTKSYLHPKLTRRARLETRLNRSFRKELRFS